MLVVAETKWPANADSACARLPWQECRNHVPYMVRIPQMGGRKSGHVPLVAMLTYENIVRTGQNSVQDTNQLAIRRNARLNIGQVTTSDAIKFFRETMSGF
jgi:hypothetical protein